MHPVIVDFGPFSLHSYGLMLAIAFALGIYVAMKRAQIFHLDSHFSLDLSVLILIFSLIGARATYVFTHWDEFQDHPFDIISPVQHNGQIGIAGLVLLGGVGAAFLTVAIYARRKQVPFLTVTDLFIPSTALGIAIGRIGCYLNGCCFGKPTSLPWGVKFPTNSLAGYVYPDTCIQPTQLYESGLMFLLFFGLLYYGRRLRPTGQITGLFLVFYGVERFWDESLRWYETDMILFQSDAFRLTFSQVLSAIMIVCGAYLLWRAAHAKELPRVEAKAVA